MGLWNVAFVFALQGSLPVVRFRGSAKANAGEHRSPTGSREQASGHRGTRQYYLKHYSNLALNPKPETLNSPKNLDPINKGAPFFRFF